MIDHGAGGAALTIALATAAGIITQSVARRLQFPGIVLLLAVGLVLGPSGVNLIDPANLGGAMGELVGFAVAVILFEGGMNLRLDELRARERPIRLLVTLGALVSFVGGTLAAKYVMGWDWRFSVLFGSLVIVTGPTVVTPLVRRIRLDPAVATVLEAEGILIDAVGAVTAGVALEIMLEPSGVGVAQGLFGIVARIGFGAVLGLVGGFVIWLFLKFRGLIDEGLENVFTLSLVWALYHISHALVQESGIAAVSIAGILVGNLKHPSRGRLLGFHDELTVMLIGMLFVLLAAGVRVYDIFALGFRGIFVVILLVVLIRPIGVFLSTSRAALTRNQRAYIAWIGPRGIIAAAIASLFAEELERAGIPGREKLTALVFLTIAITVLLAGLSGGFVAKLLGVTRAPQGWLFLGANSLACTVARLLGEANVESVCVDSSADQCAEARDMGVNVVCGSALDPETLHAAGVEHRAGAAAITSNDGINLLFIERAREDGRVPLRLMALRSATIGASAEMAHRAGGRLLFGGEQDVDLWAGRLRVGGAAIETFEATVSKAGTNPGEDTYLLLPLVNLRETEARPFGQDITVQPGDRVTFAMDSLRLDESKVWLESHGWRRVVT